MAAKVSLEEAATNVRLRLRRRECAGIEPNETSERFLWGCFRTESCVRRYDLAMIGCIVQCDASELGMRHRDVGHYRPKVNN